MEKSSLNGGDKMTQVIIILTAIALSMAVLALVGVGIVIHNIKSDKLGGTDNGDDAETIFWLALTAVSIAAVLVIAFK
jgi:hypothetical protein